MATKKKAAASANKPKTNSASEGTEFLAKVKGKNEWLSHDGQAFLITTDKKKATRFSPDYVDKIIKSGWGWKQWERAKAPKS